MGGDNGRGGRAEVAGVLLVTDTLCVVWTGVTVVTAVGVVTRLKIKKKT